MQLVSATANPDKFIEIAEILPAQIELLPRPTDIPDVVEDADDLAGNARLKASAIMEATGLAAIADDTGLEVDALQGAPGVHSARFAGDSATYEENVTKLLERLEVVAIEKEGENVHFSIKSIFTNELKVDQSLAHNGVCLTIVKIEGEIYIVTAIKETLEKSSLGGLDVGSTVNLERAMAANGRFDGHVVQGHVDQTAICKSISEEDGSWMFTFEYEPTHGNITVEKGSITVNGVSLTVVNSQPNQFSVCIIPYTKEHTTFNTLQVGDKINLEFDIIGKYVAKLMGNN